MIHFRFDLKFDIRYIFFIPLVLSILGSAFIMLSLRLIKKDKKVENWIIFFLALSDFLACFWWFLAYFLDMSGDIACQIQATGIELFFTASWMWPLIFAIRLYLNLIKDKDFDNFLVFHVMAWGIPIALCIICLARGVFGPAGLWCWITDDVYQFACGLGIVAVTFCIEIFVFVRISLVFFEHRTSFRPMEDLKRRAIGRFCMFLLVPFLCWGWAIADRVAELLNDGKPLLWLQILHGTFTASQGLANAIVYGWDAELRSEWKNLFASCLRKSHKDDKETKRLVVNLRTDEMAEPVDFKQSYYDTPEY